MSENPTPDILTSILTGPIAGAGIALLGGVVTHLLTRNFEYKKIEVLNQNSRLDVLSEKLAELVNSRNLEESSKHRLAFSILLATFANAEDTLTRLKKLPHDPSAEEYKIQSELLVRQFIEFRKQVLLKERWQSLKEFFKDE